MSIVNFHRSANRKKSVCARLVDFIMDVDGFNIVDSLRLAMIDMIRMHKEQNIRMSKIIR